jgi:hypothetical protein
LPILCFAQKGRKNFKEVHIKKKYLPLEKQNQLKINFSTHYCYHWNVQIAETSSILEILSIIFPDFLKKKLWFFSFPFVALKSFWQVKKFHYSRVQVYHFSCFLRRFHYKHDWRVVCKAWRKRRTLTSWMLYHEREVHSCNSQRWKTFCCFQ